MASKAKGAVGALTEAERKAALAEYQQDIESFYRKNDELEKKGYVPFVLPNFMGEQNIDTQVSEMYGTYEQSSFRHFFGPLSMRSDEADTLTMPPIEMKCGGNGAVRWGGWRNRLPLDVYCAVKDLVFSSTNAKYLWDLMFGRGGTPVYRYCEMVNGVPYEREVEFKYAGVVLLDKVKKAKEALDKSRAEGQPEPDGGIQQNAPDDGQPDEILIDNMYKGMDFASYRRKKEQQSPDDSLALIEAELDKVGDYQWEYEKAKQDYRDWYKANSEMQEFLANNNLDDHLKECSQDLIVCNLNFTGIGLNNKTNEKKNWTPKIVNVKAFPVVVCRYEKKDANGNINNMYFNKAWGNQILEFFNEDDSCAMYPLIGKVRQTKNGAVGLKPQLDEYVEKFSKTKVTERSNWLAVPLMYRSMENGYYPRPSWWSIFTTLLYMYARTFFMDKAVARKNSTQAKEIVYVNLDWLERKRSQGLEGVGAVADGDKEGLKKYRNSVIATYNDFMHNRMNNGKSMVADEFIGPDGKTLQKAFDVVQLPAPKIGLATTDDLYDIQNAIASAMGVHASLNGDTPGAKRSGTFQRDLHILKLSQMYPFQKEWCNFWEFVFKYNGWCPEHVGMSIKMPVLTTFDNDKSGMMVISSGDDE